VNSVAIIDKTMSIIFTFRYNCHGFLGAVNQDTSIMMTVILFHCHKLKPNLWWWCLSTNFLHHLPVAIQLCKWRHVEFSISQEPWQQFHLTWCSLDSCVEIHDMWRWIVQSLQLFPHVQSVVYVVNAFCLGYKISVKVLQ
jgi:hypothetical protein